MPLTNVGANPQPPWPSRLWRGEGHKRDVNDQLGPLVGVAAVVPINRFPRRANKRLR